MGYHEDKLNEILLALSNEIVRIRGKEDMLHLIRNSLRKYIDFDDTAILICNQTAGTYRPYIFHAEKTRLENPQFESRVNNEYFIDDYSIEDQGTPVVHDVASLVSGGNKNVSFIHSTGITEFVSIKLIERDQLIGLFVLLSEKRGVFTTEAVDLLKKITHQISIATANIIANEEIASREEERTILLSLSNEIASMKNREDLFHVVNTKLKMLLSVSEFGIAQIDEGGETYSAFVLDFADKTKQMPDFNSITSARYSVQDPVFTKVMRSEEPVLFDVEEVSEQPGMPEYVIFWKKAGFKHYLTVPLRVGGTDIGFTNFHIDDIRDINTKSNLIKGVCAQLAVAVSNILVNEKIMEREAEKARLLEFSNAMASARDKQVLGKILKTQLKKLFGIEDYTIHALSKDKKTQRAVLFDPDADFAKHPDFQQLVHTDTDVNDGVFNRILASEDLVTFNIDDWFKSDTPPSYSGAAKAINLKRMAGISIRLGEENIAVLNFRKDGISPFTFQRPLFKSICSQLAIAISNILANDEIKGREEEKSLLLEFSNAIASVRDKYIFAKILKQQLKKLFSIEDYVINILSDDQKTVNRFLYDIENDLFKKPQFLKILDTPIDVNDGIFNKILESEGPVTFKVEEWATWENPPVYLDAALATGLRNLTGIRIQLGDKNIAFLSFKHDDIGLPPSSLHFLKSICSQIAIAVSNIIANEKINQQLIEIEQYKQQLEEEKIYLKEEIETTQNYAEIIGESPAIKKVFRLVTQVAPSDSTVLLLGETGTGKELIARAIHNTSPRKGKLMIKINCAALPASLIESELFGHERGSFTGAHDRRIGKFELANHGTLFLDEIGEMPMELQVKLLRALQEKEIERIGGKTTIKTDVRIITATNRDLEKMMEEGKFRTDLYYRLNIFPISLPPLRERREDIPALATHFLMRFSKKAGKNIKMVSNKAMRDLKGYYWPGNIRELEHLIERSILLADSDIIKDIHLPDQKVGISFRAVQETLKIQTIFDHEKEYILKILKHVNGRISGEGGAAELLGIPTSTLNSRIKKLGIRKEHLG